MLRMKLIKSSINQLNFNNMKTVIIIYTCDANHYNDSKRVWTVASNKEMAIQLIKRHAKTMNESDPDNELLSDDDLYNLEHIEQTQNRSVNYIIEEFEVNCDLI